MTVDEPTQKAVPEHILQVASTAPTPPPPRVVGQNSGSIHAGFAAADLFTTDRAGTLDATVDYTFATSQIFVWIARGDCTEEQFAAGLCNFAATSFAGPKPRRISVTNATAGTYTIIMANGGSQDEAVSYQVVLTPSAASAARADGAASGFRGRYLFRLPRR